MFFFREGDLSKSREEDDSGASKGLIVLAIVFSIFGVLVILFMLYIVRRVRYRHLYMQVRSSALITFLVNVSILYTLRTPVNQRLSEGILGPFGQRYIHFRYI